MHTISTQRAHCLHRASLSSARKKQSKVLRKVLVEKCRRRYKLYSARDLVSHFQSFMATSMTPSSCKRWESTPSTMIGGQVKAVVPPGLFEDDCLQSPVEKSGCMHKESFYNVSPLSSGIDGINQGQEQSDDLPGFVSVFHSDDLTFPNGQLQSGLLLLPSDDSMSNVLSGSVVNQSHDLEIPQDFGALWACYQHPSFNSTTVADDDLQGELDALLSTASSDAAFNDVATDITNISDSVVLEWSSFADVVPTFLPPLLDEHITDTMNVKDSYCDQSMTVNDVCGNSTSDDTSTAYALMPNMDFLQTLQHIVMLQTQFARLCDLQVVTSSQIPKRIGCDATVSSSDFSTALVDNFCA